MKKSLAVVISSIISASVSNSIIAEPVLTNSELGFWSFDAGFDREGTRDFSGQNNHGYFYSFADEVLAGARVLKGGQYTKDGAKGNALIIDETDPLVIDIKQFDISKPFSVALWFKVDELNTAQTLFEQKNTQDDARYGLYLNSQNQVVVEFVDNSGSKGGLVSVPLNDIQGKWQHVVFSFDGSQYDMNMALNGKYLKTTNKGLPTLSKLDGLIILGNGAEQTPLLGELDEVHLYNRAISSTEAKCLAELGFKCVPAFYQGPRGEVGEQGATGLSGPRGDKGEKGDRGPQGEKGEKGNAGPVGSRGPQGLKGEKGDKGDQGPKGDTGPQGDPAEVYPVGSLYFNVTNGENPSKLLGMGEWQPFGQGRVILGAGSTKDARGESRNFAAGSTGGEFQHQLTIPEMPAHTHRQGLREKNKFGNTLGLVGYNGFGPMKAKNGADNIRPMMPEGGDKPHNNIQPYVTVYIWKRVK
ncbi:hypothetical protein KCM76_11215 [Zooshikella marina]|uniref:LamG domain-containing protein n=1 Tax=Zooshikella ganghwensis TaxID=202772 RepID=UPI001BAF2DEC|nr:LamG domain-containing protein [Zooshikella ganghwensis]MBU2706558.1 hypothetical protein [Zooshikella ganghwensis]